MADVNVMVAQLLSGAVDYVSRGSSLKPVQMVEIKRQCGPNGGRVFPVFQDIRSLNVNFTHPGAPWARDVRFRQAMLHSLHRQQLADVLLEGFTLIAYYHAFPEFAIYKLAQQRGLPTYEYDPSKAQQLFAAAGWTKGADGLLHDASGQAVPTFYCCRYDSADSNDIRESLAWGTDWKAAGMDVVHPIPSPPAGLSSTEQRRANAQGPRGGSIGNWRVISDQNWANLIRANIPREETRWAGINSGSYINPAYEDLFARAQSALNPQQRVELQFQMMKMVMDELPHLLRTTTPVVSRFAKGWRVSASAIRLSVQTRPISISVRSDSPPRKADDPAGRAAVTQRVQDSGEESLPCDSTRWAERGGNAAWCTTMTRLERAESRGPEFVITRIPRIATATAMPNPEAETKVTGIANVAQAARPNRIRRPRASARPGVG